MRNVLFSGLRCVGVSKIHALCCVLLLRELVFEYPSPVDGLTSHDTANSCTDDPILRPPYPSRAFLRS